MNTKYFGDIFIGDIIIKLYSYTFIVICMYVVLKIIKW